MSRSQNQSRGQDLNEKNSSKQVYDLFKEWGIKETETVDFPTFQKFYQAIVDGGK